MGLLVITLVGCSSSFSRVYVRLWCSLSVVSPCAIRGSSLVWLMSVFCSIEMMRCTSVVICLLLVMLFSVLLSVWVVFVGWFVFVRTSVSLLRMRGEWVLSASAICSSFLAFVGVGIVCAALVVESVYGMLCLVFGSVADVVYWCAISAVSWPLWVRSSVFVSWWWMRAWWFGLKRS